MKFRQSRHRRWPMGNEVTLFRFPARQWRPSVADNNVDTNDWEAIERQEVEMVLAALDELSEKVAELSEKVAGQAIAAELQSASDRIAELAEWEDDTDQAEAA